MTQLPDKPPFRSACNSCGLCCRLQLFGYVAQHFPGASAPCPALEIVDSRAVCGLVRRPSHHLQLKFNGDAYLSPLFFQAIGAGQGCGMEDGVDVEAELEAAK